MDIDITNISSSEINLQIQTNKKVKYDHHKKMELVKKINKIKKKEYLVNIFKIITLGSKDFTENTNGVFVFFHNLDDETYDKLDNYVSLIYKLHKKSNSLENILTTELSDSLLTYSENDNIDKIDFNNVNRELSNKEKMIMRRKKYEEYLNTNQG